MKDIAVWGFSWVPPFAQGLVRDLRVRWALEEAGLPYESKWIGTDERHSESYRRKQPFGVVPALDTDGGTMIESGAIIYAIAEQCDALMPPNQRTETLAWMFAALNTVEPPILELTTTMLFERDKPWTAERLPMLRDRVTKRLDELATWLGDADWLDGDFSAADILMIHALRRLGSSGLLDDYPSIAAYIARGEARPAYQRAFAAQLEVFRQSKQAN